MSTRQKVKIINMVKDLDGALESVTIFVITFPYIATLQVNQKFN